MSTLGLKQSRERVVAWKRVMGPPLTEEQKVPWVGGGE